MKFLPLLLILAATLQAQELTPTETTDLLARIASSRRGVSLQTDFREEKHLAMMDQPVVESGTLAFLPPDKFRREVKGKSLTVCDGATLWLYYPAFQEVEKYALGSNRMLRESLMAMTAGLGLQDVEKNYAVKASHLGSGYRVELTPKTSALHRMVAHITLDLNASLSADRMEIETGKDESSTLTFSNERHVKPDPANFTFQPPSGVSITEPLAK